MQYIRTIAALALFCLSAGIARGAVMTVVPGSGTGPSVPIYLARPHGAGPFPAVVLLHGCEGFNGFAAVAADRLTALGYVAVALDSLGMAQPLGVCGGGPDGAKQEAAAARATLAWLRTQPYVLPDKLAVIGSSMGGIATLDLVDPIGAGLSAPLGLRAAVAFYPACDARDGRSAVPLEIFAGDADQIAPAAACSAMVRAGKAAGSPIDITVYPGATHGFQVPGPDRTFFGQVLRYDASAAADSAERIKQFLALHLQ